MSAEKRIFGEGFISGIFAGIAFKTGISMDEGGIITLFIKTFCEATEEMQGSFNCWKFVTLISLLALVASVFAIVEAINNADDLRIGAVIYVAGSIIGFIFIAIFA